MKWFDHALRKYPCTTLFKVMYIHWVFSNKICFWHLSIQFLYCTHSLLANDYPAACSCTYSMKLHIAIIAWSPKTYNLFTLNKINLNYTQGQRYRRCVGGGRPPSHSLASRQIVISVGKTGLVNDNPWTNWNGQYSEYMTERIIIFILSLVNPEKLNISQVYSVYHFEFGKQKHQTTHADMNIYSIFKFSISHFLAVGINNWCHATLVSCKQFSVTTVPFRLRGSKHVT